MTPRLRRHVLALCWIAIVGGVLLFLAGVYTGYAEGVRADETQTAGRLMPAEALAFVLGPVLVVAGAVVVASTRHSTVAPVEAR